MLRFANQPSTTRTGWPVRDGHHSIGDPVRVEIFDTGTNAIVDTDAAVTLTLRSNAGQGKLVGGVARAVGGAATFPDLSIDTPGFYTLEASSPAADDTPVSEPFIVADGVAICDGPGWSFTETRDGQTFTTRPEQASAGARWATSVNLPGVRVSGGRHYFDCGGTILACFDPRGDGDDWDARPNPDHVYFAVDDLEAVFDRAKRAGCRKIEEQIKTRPWGERSFYATDPFGNKLCFVDSSTVFTGR